MDKELAILSEAVYLPEWEDVRKYIEPNWKLISPLDIEDTESMIVSNGKFNVLVFRGTEASRGNLSDLFNNLGNPKDWEGPGYVHSGYWRYMSKVYDIAHTCLDRAEQFPLIVTGHSMGGAAATLFCLKTKFNNRRDIDSLVVFGSPKTLNRKARTVLENLNIRRYVNRKDLADKWPLNPWMVHVSPKIKHNEEGHSITNYVKGFN